MTIQIKCPGCGRGGTAPDGALGRTVLCPGCGSKVIVADSSVKAAGNFAIDDPSSPPQINTPAQTAVFRGFPRSRVQGPAIALIITAVIGIGFSLTSMVQSVFYLRAMPQINQGIGKLVENVATRHQDKVGDAREVQEAFGMVTSSIVSSSGTMEIIMSLLSMIGGGIVLGGALSMMSLRRYPLAIIGSVLAMIPTIGPCCVLGLPFGIWALVVLCQPDVRSAFSSQASPA